MNRRFVFEAIMVVALLWVWWRLPPADSTVPAPVHARPLREPAATVSVKTTNTTQQRTAASPELATNSTPGSSPLIGELILRDYASPSNSPEHDLSLMSELMQNFTLIVKSAATRPLSANEDWARALRGFNPAHERFLPDQHIALNSQGQLVDRWGSPLLPLRRARRISDPFCWPGWSALDCR